MREKIEQTKKSKDRKLIDFKDLIEVVQNYADVHCEGNFSMAVRTLVKKGLAA